MVRRARPQRDAGIGEPQHCPQRHHHRRGDHRRDEVVGVENHRPELPAHIKRSVIGANLRCQVPDHREADRRKQQQLGDPDRRDRSQQRGRGEEASHEEKLHHGPHHERDEQASDQRHPVGESPDLHDDDRHRRRQRAEFGLGETHGVVRPEDHRHTQRDHGAETTHDRPRNGHSRRHRPQEHLQHNDAQRRNIGTQRRPGSLHLAPLRSNLPPKVCTDRVGHCTGSARPRGALCDYPRRSSVPSRYSCRHCER